MIVFHGSLVKVKEQGGDDMIPEITDKNLYLLLPGKVSAIVGRYVDENSVNLLDGLRTFYKSMTYKNLENEQTKTWHLGPVALYQMFKDETADVVSDTPQGIYNIEE